MFWWKRAPWLCTDQPTLPGFSLTRKKSYSVLIWEIVFWRAKNPLPNGFLSNNSKKKNPSSCTDGIVCHPKIHCMQTSYCWTGSLWEHGEWISGWDFNANLGFFWDQSLEQSWNWLKASHLVSNYKHHKAWSPPPRDHDFNNEQQASPLRMLGDEHFCEMLPVSSTSCRRAGWQNSTGGPGHGFIRSEHFWRFWSYLDDQEAWWLLRWPGRKECWCYG